MLTSTTHLNQLSLRYNIPAEDILLIGLNACGAKSSLPFPRARFKLRLHSHPEDIFYVIVSLGRSSSPFTLTPQALLFQNEPFADVLELENDDVVVSYFRNNNSILTLNSNSRSHCTGCVFCYNTLETSSDPRLKVVDDLDNYVALLKAEHGAQAIHGLSEVAVCTGCFNEEGAAIDHLAMVRRVFTRHGFNGRIAILSSVIRSEKAFDRIATEVAPFHLTLTAECFTGREDILKRSKADLSPEEMPGLLSSAKNRGFETDFTYIVGLDDFDTTVNGLRLLSRSVTQFPRLQVYQPHNDFMGAFVASDAGRIEYYLRVRTEVESIYGPTGLRPRSYQNYRPLWYLTFAEERLAGPRI